MKVRHKSKSYSGDVGVFYDPEFDDLCVIENKTIRIIPVVNLMGVSMGAVYVYDVQWKRSHDLGVVVGSGFMKGLVWIGELWPN